MDFGWNRPWLYNSKCTLQSCVIIYECTAKVYIPIILIQIHYIPSKQAAGVEGELMTTLECTGEVELSSLVPCDSAVPSVRSWCSAFLHRFWTGCVHEYCTCIYLTTCLPTLVDDLFRECDFWLTYTVCMNLTLYLRCHDIHIGEVVGRDKMMTCIFHRAKSTNWTIKPTLPACW